MNITITGITARSVNVPLEFPVKTSVGIVATAPLVLIDLRTSSGVIGRSYLFTYTPAALEATRQMVLSLGRFIEGVPLAPFDIDTLFSQRLRLLGKTGIALMACSGIDMAVWDALAVSQKQPLAKLLGGSIRPIKAYDSHSMDGVELGVTRASKSRNEGYTAIKTKIGYATLQEDLHVVRELRKAIGPEAQLLVDYNQGLTVPEAIRRISALQDEGISWVEEPTLQEDFSGHARIRNSVSLPIQMGENWFGPEEMHKALVTQACDFAMPDVMKIGGVTGWLRAAALAHSHGIPMSSHIFQEISVHLLAVTPTCHFLERMDLAGPVLQTPLQFVNGSATPPDEPGVGLRWNEEAVTQFAA